MRDSLRWNGHVLGRYPSASGRVDTITKVTINAGIDEGNHSHPNFYANANANAISDVGARVGDCRIDPHADGPFACGGTVPRRALPVHAFVSGERVVLW